MRLKLFRSYVMDASRAHSVRRSVGVTFIYKMYTTQKISPGRLVSARDEKMLIDHMSVSIEAIVLSENSTQHTLFRVF